MGWDICQTKDARPGAKVASMRTSTVEVGRLCERSRIGHGLAVVVIARCRYLGRFEVGIVCEWRSGAAFLALCAS